MEYEVIFSERKTLALQIKDGRLIVRAPHGTRESKIKKALATHERWIAEHLARSEARRSREELSDEEISRLKRAAKAVLPAKAEYYARIMGARYNRITVTSAKTRFGSCSARGNISFSYRLMLYPEAAIDYVVVHELAHLYEMNHSQRFYKIVEKYLPDYKERRRLLKK